LITDANLSHGLPTPGSQNLCRERLRLPRSDAMTEERRLTLQNSSDSIELVWPESNARTHSGQLQMASVIAPLAKAVVPLVINGPEFTRPSFITPKPFNELRFDLGQFRLRGDRLGVIEDAPLTRRLVNLVVDQGLMEVQGVLDEVDCIHSNSAPGLRGLDRIARPEVGA